MNQIKLNIKHLLPRDDSSIELCMSAERLNVALINNKTLKMKLLCKMDNHDYDQSLVDIINKLSNVEHAPADEAKSYLMGTFVELESWAKTNNAIII